MSSKYGRNRVRILGSVRIGGYQDVQRVGEPVDSRENFPFAGTVDEILDKRPQSRPVEV